MYVSYSGWTEKHGSFFSNIFIDEKRQDYALVYGNGFVAKQTTPFQSVTADWNNDGDVYTQFGAWFQSPFGGNTFYTPEEMVQAAADSLAKERFYSNEVKEVRGVTIPLPEHRPRLEDRIRQTENRVMQQETERNRKMDALGVRRPGEPWAR